MKKISTIILSMILVISLFTGCGNTAEEAKTSNKETKAKNESVAKKDNAKAKDEKSTEVEKMENEEAIKEDGSATSSLENESEGGNKEEVKSSSENADGNKEEVKSSSGNAAPGNSNGTSTGNEEVVEESPKPTVPAPTPEAPVAKYVTLSITCNTILNNMDKVSEGKKNIIPSNGVILGEIQVEIQDGDTVFDVLKKETRNNRIHMDFVETPVYNSAYIKGIANIYEFDAGDLSGWMYSVNGSFPNYGVSQYDLQSGDRIEFKYTCDLGKDL